MRACDAAAELVCTPVRPWLNVWACALGSGTTPIGGACEVADEKMLWTGKKEKKIKWYTT